MRFSIFITAWIITLLLLASCNKRISDASEDLPEVNLPKYGEETTLEVLSWNIEQFAKHGKTIGNVRDIILDLDADIFAVQEITASSDFERLLDSLNAVSDAEWDGRLNRFSTNLMTGIIYKKSIVTVEADTYLFVGDFDFAGRPPHVLYLNSQNNNKLFDFTLIILHLKAFQDPESRGRRQRAIQKLENWVSRQLQDPNNDPDFILVGDWNDELDQPAGENVFLPFLADTANYLFLTGRFVGIPGEFTFIGGGFESLIDHILMTRTVESAYPAFSSEILKIDQSFVNYEEQVSDHRPVGTKYPAF